MRARLAAAPGGGAADLDARVVAAARPTLCAAVAPAGAVEQAVALLGEVLDDDEGDGRSPRAGRAFARRAEAAGRRRMSPPPLPAPPPRVRQIQQHHADLRGDLAGNEGGASATAPGELGGSRGRFRDRPLCPRPVQNALGGGVAHGVARWETRMRVLLAPPALRRERLPDAPPEWSMAAAAAFSFSFAAA